MSSSISSNLRNFERGLNNLSPNKDANNSNGETSNDNFLKTGDNNLIEYANLAGHLTNFVDNEASLDFLSSSHAKVVNEY